MTLNSRDQAKWDSLQNKGGNSIDKILAGKASDADIQELSRVLAEQHELAGQIFDQGVLDAQATADTIVDRLNKERIESGKKPLTLKAQERVFRNTFQQVLSQSLEDVLGMIHDEFETHSKSTREGIEKALEKLKGFTAPVQQKQPVPAGVAPPVSTPQDTSLFERFTRKAKPEQKEAKQERRSLMERLFSKSEKQERQKTSIFQAMRENVSSAKDKLSNLYNKFKTRNDDSDEDKKASIWVRKLKAVFDPARNAAKKVKAAGSKIGSLLSMIGKPLLLALMNPQLITTITDAVSKYLNFDTISKFVSGAWDDVKKMGSSAIDWVLEKVKSFFGFGKDDKKKTEPAKPRVDPLKQNTNTGTLPAQITSVQAQQKLQESQQKLVGAKQNLSAAVARYQANPTPANKAAVEDAKRTVEFFQTRITQYSARANQPTAGSTIAQAQTFVKPEATAEQTTAPVMSGSDKPVVSTAALPGIEVPKTSTQVTAADPTVVMSKSSVAMPPSTTVVSDMPTYTAGKAFDPPEKLAEDNAAKEKRGAATAQIGLGSFGFDSGDPSLNIMNLGMLS